MDDKESCHVLVTVTCSRRGIIVPEAIWLAARPGPREPRGKRGARTCAPLCVHVHPPPGPDSGDPVAAAAYVSPILTSTWPRGAEIDVEPYLTPFSPRSCRTKVKIVQALRRVSCHTTLERDRQPLPPAFRSMPAFMLKAEDSKREYRTTGPR